MWHSADRQGFILHLPLSPTHCARHYQSRGREADILGICCSLVGMPGCLRGAVGSCPMLVCLYLTKPPPRVFHS